MDPTECLAGLLGELASIGPIEPDVARLHHSTARTEAISRLRGLAHWMESNGFPPDVDTAIATYRSRAERGGDA